MGLGANLHNVVVFIKDEAELEAAREMLEKNGQEIEKAYGYFYVSVTYKFRNFLKLKGNKWITGIKYSISKQITLTELEQLIKKEKEDER